MGLNIDSNINIKQKKVVSRTKIHRRDNTREPKNEDNESQDIESSGDLFRKRDPKLFKDNEIKNSKRMDAQNYT